MAGAGWSGRVAGRGPRPRSTGGWRRRLARARRADLDAGRTVELDGWLVTPTEARLLALAARR